MADTNETTSFTAAAYSSQGTARDSVALPGDLFDGTVNMPVMHQAVKAFLANQRQGNASTKIRKYVTGGNQKPWKQKGTGRARVGEIRNPLWRKGGTVFGPQPRSYDYALPKKVERGALRAALTAKFRAGAVTVVDVLAADAIKTKPAAALLKRLGATGRTLVVDVKPNENFALSARNVAGVTVVASGRLTARDVMNTTRIIATRAAVERLQEVLA